MAQLVGTNCVHCRNRISNEIDAEFCPVCGHPRHLACGQPVTGTANRCTRCGAAYDAAGRATQQETERQAATPRPLNLVAHAQHAAQLVRLAKFLGMAVLFIILAFALVLIPDFRSDPNRITLRDVPYSVALATGAVAFGLVGWWLYRNDRRRSARGPH